MHPISESLWKAYNKLYEEGQVKFPLHQKQKESLDGIVKTVCSEYFGHVPYLDAEIKAAAFMCYIIKDHPVTDGNKRLSVLWVQAWCDVHSLKINDVVSLDELAVGIEQSPIKMGGLIAIVKSILFR